jgi:hypothetical protein
LQLLATEAGEPVVPTPTRSMISSFASYDRLILRGGAAVGGQSLQHIYDFAEDCALTPESEENEAGCIECVIDCERAEPFFAIVLSTKKLLSEFDNSKPIETDENYKVMHEGYALTLIGQSDMNRVWHVR